MQRADSASSSTLPTDVVGHLREGAAERVQRAERAVSGTAGTVVTELKIHRLDRVPADQRADQVVVSDQVHRGEDLRLERLVLARVRARAARRGGDVLRGRGPQ